MSGAFIGILTVSTEDAPLIGVMLTCDGCVTDECQRQETSKTDHIYAGVVFELAQKAGCEDEPSATGSDVV